MQAVGCANAEALLDPASDAVTLVTTGEGATSEGEFWESLNVAWLERLPLLYLMEDNGYAISVPVEKQTAGGNIASWCSSFPDSGGVRVRRHKFSRLRTAPWRDAVAHCRRGAGPRAGARHLHAAVFALAFRRRKAVQAAKPSATPKPPAILGALSGVASSRRHPGYARSLEMLMHQVDLEIQEATRVCTEGPASGGRRSAAVSIFGPRRSDIQRIRTEPQFDGHPRTMVDSINLTLHEEMRRNPKMVVFGEDVADCSREENLGEVKGKGGVFKATLGLQTRLRLAARVQHAHRRGLHRRPSHRHGHARTEACGRDPVFRLHLARDDADPR